ncbi:PEP-CTERM sorting domain-containing protein [bacterium]|nr:MAG: PEP-CTERM sorting domain-containing protein [bacterium]
MRKILITGATALGFASLVSAQTSVTLDFGGSGNTLAATGFDSVLNEDNTAYNVAGGVLSMITRSGDIFGNYENDPDVAKNIFSSNLEMTAGTIMDAHVTVSGLNVNFHGGGIWMGLDTDHYIRLGVINVNTNLVVEGIRENEDLWNDPGSGHNGPGGDIVGIQSGSLGPTPQVGSLEFDLRLIRSGTDVSAFYQVGGGGYVSLGTFNDFRTVGGGFTEGSQLMVGVYAFGGPDQQDPATFDFDSFSASAVPEPASMLALGIGALAMLRRRKGR